MCTIFGGIGNLNRNIIEHLSKTGVSRGRDGTNIEYYDGDCRCALGNCRAAPTHEAECPQLQPYDGVVHNGTIANDVELGNKEGNVDSLILPKILDRSNFDAFVKSLDQIQGSYAIAVYNKIDSIYLATNYKPLHYWAKSQSEIYFSSMEQHFDGLIPFGQRCAVVEPYSAVDLLNNKIVPLKRKFKKRALVVASAGLDSITCAADLKYNGWEIKLLHFTYGCKAGQKETDLIPKIAGALNCEYDIIEVPYEKMKGSSSIMTDGDIAENAGMELAHEWVPARNLVFASLAAAYAEANGFHAIALGNNLEESGSHPDNEEQMTVLLDKVFDYAVADGYELRALSPLGNLTKKEIAKLAYKTNAPLEHSWSCYNNGDLHCGVCGPCKFRRTAFERAGLMDKVEYVS